MTTEPDMRQKPLCASLEDVAAQFSAKASSDFTRLLPSHRVAFAPLELLQHRFGLTDLETSLILLLALEATYPEALIGVFPAGTGRDVPPPRIRIVDLQNHYPSEFDPRIILNVAPLFYWHLISSSRPGLHAEPLVVRPLQLDERVLAFLLGVHLPDTRLTPYLDDTEPTVVLTPEQAQCASEIATLWKSARDFSDFKTIALCGKDRSALCAIAHEAARIAGLAFGRSHLAALPDRGEERLLIIRLWQREALLEQRALYLETCELADAPDDRSVHTQTLSEWVRSRGGAIVIGCGGERALPEGIVLMNAPPTRQEDRRVLIAAALNGRTPKNSEFIAQLSEQFDIGAVALHDACNEAMAAGYPAASGDPSESGLSRALWDACRRRARPKLGSLVQQIHSKASWCDLVLPDDQTALLHEAVAQVSHRARVYYEWGFAEKSSRGLNLTALFSGPSGSGKTLAAEVVANALGLDLLRVDLSAVISKYIGETEERLRAVFDAAEPGGAVLLFDEADALFGRRSEVSDSRDRNSNMEVSYLLQRLESFRGLAILTTNYRENLDSAFLRRIRFHVEFPFPDRDIRAQIWRASFPPNAPVDAIDFRQLGRLSLTGGHIRNIALNAAFRAAREGKPIASHHIAAAARSEFRKSEKPVPEGDLRQLVASSARNLNGLQ